MFEEIIDLFNKNPVIAISILVVIGIILLVLIIKFLVVLGKVLWWLITLPFRIIAFPFRLIFGNKKKLEPSQLHRSKDWGGQPHVDLYERNADGKVISQDHGHSPTIHSPKREDGAVKLKKEKDLPPPYGDV